MKKELLTGNQAAIKGCLASGAEFMSGYPITPTTEMIEGWAEEKAKQPRLGFLQTEDETSAGFALIGAVLSGKKAFTATAGPGNILMQDPMAMAENMRLPTVVFVNQRGGPSTGTVIYSQQEVFLTCFGGNGEGLRIVYSVSGPQEMYDYAIKAFNTAWNFRFPTFVMSDGYSAKTLTEVETYQPEEKQIEQVSASAFLLNEKKEPGTYINLRNTYNLEHELNEVLQNHRVAFDAITPQIVEYEDHHTLDAEIVVFAHGIVATAAKKAVDFLRSENKKIGLFRPITLNPFPKDSALAVMPNKKKVLVVESSLGQFEKLVKENLYGISVPIETYKRPALGIMPDEIIEVLRQMLQGER